jgi:hypothetical protein
VGLQDFLEGTVHNDSVQLVTLRWISWRVKGVEFERLVGKTGLLGEGSGFRSGFRRFFLII